MVIKLGDHLKTTFYVLILSLCTTAIIAQEGVQFEAVPISINSSCDPVIFRGTQRYAGTAFLMPRLHLARTSRGTDALEFVKLSNKYIMQLGLYFPRFAIRNEYIHYEDYTQSECNYNQIKQAINQGITTEANKVKHIVTLQIKNIGVEVNGVDGEYKVASEKTSILQYQGQTKKIEIPFTSKDQMDDTLARLRSDIGLNVNVNFEFLARKSNGYCKLKINTDKIADQVGAMINAQFSGESLSKIKLAPNQVHAALGAAVKKVGISMDGSSYCEEGSNTQFQQASYQLLMAMTKKMGEDLSEYRPTSLYDSFGTGGGNDWGSDDDWDTPSDGLGGLSGTTPSGGLLDPTDDQYDVGYGNYGNNRNNGDGFPPLPKPIKFKGDGIGAQAMIQHLKQQKSFTFEMMNMGQNEVQTFTASLLIKRDEDEAGRSRLTLSSENGSIDTRIDIKAGDEIRIYPLREVTRNISYKELVTYYDKNALENVDEFKHFPILSRELVSSIKEEQTTGGTIAYIEKTHTTWDVLPLVFAQPSFTVHYTKYNWGEINYQAVKEKPIEKSYDASHMSSYDLAKLFEIGFIFNKKSPSVTYSLNTLQKTSGTSSLTFANLSYDETDNAYILKADQNLGTLRLKNLKKTKTRQLALKRHFQDVKMATLLTSYGKKVTRTFSKNDPVQTVPTQINEQVFKIEKVGSLGGGSNFEIPINLYNESSGSDAPIILDGK